MRPTWREALRGCSYPSVGQEKDRILQKVLGHAPAEHREVMRKMTEDDETATRRTMRTALEEKQQAAQAR